MVIHMVWIGLLRGRLGKVGSKEIGEEPILDETLPAEISQQGGTVERNDATTA
jgi:hypothetical protein